jgi:hypothetical protein
MRRLFVLVLLIALPALGQKQPKIDPSSEIPVISADVGQCTADFRVVDVNMKPIYSARIALDMKRGFMGMRRTSLEIFTNSDGKARFTGLPNYSKHPLNFDVSFGERKTGVFMDPDEKCQADFQAVLPDKKNAPATPPAPPAEEKQ